MNEKVEKIDEQGKKIDAYGKKVDELAARSILSDSTRTLLKESVLPLSLDGGGKFVPIGVMFFVSPECAVTANHNLGSKKTDDYVYYKQPGQRSPSMISVCFQDEQQDFAILRCGKGKHAHLALLDTSASPPECGVNFLLAAYQIGITEELGDDFETTFGLMQGCVTKTSKNHMVYQSTTFAGDSGAALTLVNGNVIGIHVEGVNQAKERLRKKSDVNERLTEVENSVDGLIKGTAQGCIGLLAHVVLKALNGMKEYDGVLSLPNTHVFGK